MADRQDREGVRLYGEPAKAEETPQPEEEDVKIYEPRPSGVRNAPEEGPVHRDTRILDFIRRRPGKGRKQEEELEGQITFEGMEEQERRDQEQELEERLQDVRREKVENFRLIRSDAEDGGKEEEPEPEKTEDYNSYAETAAVRGELLFRRRRGRIGLLAAGIMEFLLVSMMLAAQVTRTVPIAPITYLSLNLGLLAGIMLVAHQVIADGITGVFTLRAGADSVTAVAAFSATVHTILQYPYLTDVANGEVTLYTTPAGLALLLALIGRYCRISRILRNFRIVSANEDKAAAAPVEDHRQLNQLSRYVQEVGTPFVVYPRKSDFLTKFLENSYDDEGHESFFRWFSPAMMLSTLAASVTYMLLGGETANWYSALGLWSMLLCMASPAFAVAGANIPFVRLCQKLVKRDALLVGWRAADTFRDVNAVTVDAKDLFPEETVVLHGIRTFAGARIDEAILDAAAVSIKAGGPLEGVFRRAIENREDMLQEVDTLLYEQDMGLSGWVGGHRVLVGNRRLLENHGLDVPSLDYEMRYTKENRKLVYLASNGVLCAMFVVSYGADDVIREAVRRLADGGITLLVRTCDPNVTQELICSAFDVEEESVRVLDMAAARVFDSLTDQPAENREALLAGNGSFAGFGLALAACRPLCVRVRLTGILQMVGAALGTLLAGVAAALDIAVVPLAVCAHLLFWAGITWGAARFGGK